MFEYGLCTENYNPELLFAFQGVVDTAKKEYDFKYHCHDFLELSIVTSGKVEYYIDGNEYILNKGDLLLSNPGLYHMETPNEKSKYTQLHIGINNFKLSEIRENYIDNKGVGPVLRFKKYENEFLKCCDEIIKEEKMKRMGYPLVLKSLVMKLLIIICRELEDEEEKVEENIYSCSLESNEKQNIVKSIISYMNSNYMNDISLDKISKNMYLSPVYISKIFKEEIGDSPINYLIKIRLAKAEELLKDNTLPVKVIAKRVGYNDAYHFSKLFKKYYGVSPSSFR
ncbi:MAG: AraC family transcriptional regulator [Clostridium sp.]|uniref:AraC family transcriptional regulator n=1 Tax=Clostridium sp. TaxID=1506 RepID=UPI0025B9353A|nr:AraC family transcriptional regulator [Clostridium sp.]MBS4957225.1 AraC family transcriptional regulator [Clostridium sp.]